MYKETVLKYQMAYLFLIADNLFVTTCFLLSSANLIWIYYTLNLF